jgi:hypothetical protein
LIAREGDRVRLLVDREAGGEAELEAFGLKPLADVAMTLEDLFLALTSGPMEMAP